jgi:hypothetical protein
VFGTSACSDAAREAEHRRLAGAPLHHLAGLEPAGHAAVEHHPAPAAIDHSRHIVPRQSHAGHHVGLDEAPPVLVGDVEEARNLGRTGVADENVDVDDRRRETLELVGHSDVSGDAMDGGAGHSGPEPVDGFTDAAVVSTVHDDRCPSLGQSASDGEAHARRGASDEGASSREVDPHRG